MPAIAGWLALLLVASPARAITAFTSDCASAWLQSSFNPGDAVCVTGEVDIVPPGKICGEAYVLVTPHDSVDPFVDVTEGGANYIIACGIAGGFYDEYVWLPPLKPGTYDIVIDQYPFFGAFDPATDYRTDQPAFTVSNAPLVFSVDVAAIKKAAESGLAAAKGIQTLTFYLNAIDVLNTAADWTMAVGPLGGAAGIGLGVFCYITDSNCPTSYNSAVIAIGNKILNGIAESLTLKYASIIADPPDADFETVVGLTMDVADWTPGATANAVKRQLALAQLLAVQAAAYGALRPTLEKLQGAQIAGSNLGMLLQSEKAKAYTQLAISAGDALLLEADALEADVAGSTGADAAELAAIVSGIVTGGFSADDQDTLASYGLTATDLAAVKDALAAQKVPAAVDAQALIAAIRATFVPMRPALVDLAAQAEAVRKENEPLATRPGPVVAIAPPAGGVVGQAQTLTMSVGNAAPASITWDLDLDGAFDDDSGATASFVPKAPGTLLVAVRAADAAGHADVAHALVTVTAANAPPELTALAPAELAPYAEVGAVVAFHAEALDADGDAVKLTWHLDGQAQGVGSDYKLKMPDEAPHSVSVVASDTDPWSPDAKAVFLVRAAKWQDGGEPIVPPPEGDAPAPDVAPPVEDVAAPAVEAPAAEALAVEAPASDVIGDAGAVEPKEPKPRNASAGGCGCQTPGRAPPIDGAIVLLAVLGAATSARRARSRRACPPSS